MKTLFDMKNFDLNSMGVQEMDPREMQEIDGGWLVALIFGYIFLEACLNPQAHINSFKEGWNAAS
jgi:hypothetical protein